MKNQQVDASTTALGGFFSDSRLLVPDFQRRYSWKADEQVSDFWSDLQSALGTGDYFLGLIILADYDDRLEVVDGQQRIVTVTVLANVLRLAALALGRRLIAESIRTDFLFSMDFKTEEQVPRVVLSEAEDHADLSALLTANSTDELELREGSAIHSAHAFLAARLQEDLEAQDNRALRVGQWTEFLTKSVTFAVFMHPDRGAAFRVYEVVNTRGKDLTPTELIKAYLIGSGGEDHRDDTHQRWKTLEEQLESVGALDQLTTYVRHVVTLEYGYVTPRDLYQVVSKNYVGPEGVDAILSSLERHLPGYVQMIDPAADIESSEEWVRGLVLTEKLALTRFRPVFMAAGASDSPGDRLSALLRVLIPAALVGNLASGRSEAIVARVARRLVRDSNWDRELARLAELKPSRDEFVLRFDRGLNRQQALVFRAALLTKSALPSLDGLYVHQLRPKNAQNWPEFEDNSYRQVGSSIANWILTQVERRPQGSRTPSDVIAKLLPVAAPGESVSAADVQKWSAGAVERANREIAARLSELWYEHH